MPFLIFSSKVFLVGIMLNTPQELNYSIKKTNQHSNVAITVLANTFVDIVGNTNTAIPRHISYLANIPITNILVKGGCALPQV
jgi:hypothetical protein